MGGIQEKVTRPWCSVHTYSPGVSSTARLFTTTYLIQDGELVEELRCCPGPMPPEVSALDPGAHGGVAQGLLEQNLGPASISRHIGNPEYNINQCNAVVRVDSMLLHLAYSLIHEW